MYDWPEVQWAHDALWSVIAERLDAHGIAAPETLERERPAEEVWRDPGLVLSQTCGWPFVTRLGRHVRLVATPVYAVDGCQGPRYSSLLIARRSGRGDRLRDFAGRRFAFNSDDSLSGYVAVRAAMRGDCMDPDRVEWIETGSHRASIHAVAADIADIAGIDAVCWALAQRFEPEVVRRLETIGRTPLRPALPFVTALHRGDADLAAIREALGGALASAESAAARAALALSGSAILQDAEYELLRELGGASAGCVAGDCSAPAPENRHSHPSL
jgi:ABC-type phosphate/phosphonate transport system substrate-binding protein